MSYENPLEPNIFSQMEPLDYIIQCKQQAIDKNTNNTVIDNNRHQFHNAFQNSPLRSSFFFTPNSPKPLLFDCMNDQTSRKGNKNYINFINTGPSISKKLDLYDDQLDQMNEDQRSSQKAMHFQKPAYRRSHGNSKGLKNLSESVYMIVSQLSVTKYKEVADRLVSQIASSKTTQLQNPKDDKDQHNIKRRVYDALNVLIAAGLLRKQGKEVACNEPYRKSKSNKKKNMKQSRQINKLQEELISRYNLFQQKQQKYLRLLEKRNLIEYIIKRNKKSKHINNFNYKFPLISFSVDQQYAKKCHSTDNFFMIKTKETPMVYGDVDMLLEMNKDTIQMDNLLDNICSQAKVQEGF